MTARTLKILAVVVVVLFVAIFALNRQGSVRQPNELLYPGLKDRMNDVSAVTIANADGTLTIKREGDRWIVPDKAGYEADTDTLRQLLLALADARKIEQKTSNPEFYDRLGVQDPAKDDSSSVLVTSAGLGDSDFSLILGNPVQGKNRYVRIPDEAESWLIDQNPDIPADSGGWLSQDIADIDAARVQSVTIAHSDGETVSIHKDNADTTNFDVEDIPEGRELSYPSVANGIASVLSNLTLEDVVADDGSGDESPATTVFTTFDGLRISVASTTEDDQTWITLQASAIEKAETPDEGDTIPPSEDTATTENEDAPSSADATVSEQAGPPEEEKADPAAEAAEINALVSGWKYRIADYKVSQLTRRWDDLLKAEE